MEQPIQPPEGTPLPPAPVGVPPFPITPFAVWTWSSPVIPEFYWNVYSSEQRIKQICKEIGKIEAYLQYLVSATNSNIIEIHQRIDALTERVAALEKKVDEEVARLDALIAQLRADLEQEIHDREQGDENLDRRITQEIHDRQDADQVLHNEISQEVQDRIHADDQLHEEISHRLLPTDIQAGAEIEITRPDPNSNTIVIASTVAHSIAELASTVSGLQAALTSETEERRADDAALWTAVNERIERGKILAGTGIKVVNDPDESTVTISATGGGTGGATEITGTAPITVTDGEDGEKIVGVSEATEDEAGVISEARVKELAAGEGTAYSAGAGISISGNQISAKPATEEEAGIISESRVKALASGPSLSAEAPLKLEDGTISVREITPETSSETETGVVSKETIKSLALASGGAYPGLAPDRGLEYRPDLGGIGVNVGSRDWNSIGLGPDGELTLPGGPTRFKTETQVIDLNGIGVDDDDTFFKAFCPISLARWAGPGNGGPAVTNWTTKFVLTDGFFEVKNGSGGWENAHLDCFEVFAEADRLSSQGYPIDHSLYVRLTPRGQAVYTKQDPGDTGKEKITHIKVTYTVYNLYISPTEE